MLAAYTDRTDPDDPLAGLVVGDRPEPEAREHWTTVDVRAPTHNLVPKPPELTFVEAACVPTAWLTAYRMLFTAGGAAPGDRVLVQGAGGGVATAAVALGAAAGLEVWVTSRSV